LRNELLELKNQSKVRTQNKGGREREKKRICTKATVDATGKNSDYGETKGREGPRKNSLDVFCKKKVRKKGSAWVEEGKLPTKKKTSR